MVISTSNAKHRMYIWQMSHSTPPTPLLNHMRCNLILCIFPQNGVPLCTKRAPHAYNQFLGLPTEFVSQPPKIQHWHHHCVNSNYLLIGIRIQQKWSGNQHCNYIHRWKSWLCIQIFHRSGRWLIFCKWKKKGVKIKQIFCIGVLLFLLHKVL